MKNGTWTTTGVRTTFWDQSQTTDSTSLTLRRTEVTSGAIVHGNMRDPNNWSYQVTRSQFIEGVVEAYQSGKRIYRQEGPLNGTSVPVLPSWDRNLVYNMALNRLNEKVRGQLDLGLALAESGSTLRMLKNFGKLYRHARGVPRKVLANGWLEFQYGWRPLISDIFGAADEAIRVCLNQISRVRARAKLPFEGSYASSQTVSVAIPTHGLRRGAQSCTFVLDLWVPSFDIARWTSLNPVSLGWELIPFSFVVDWVFDIGSFLRNLESALLYNAAFRGGYISELYVCQAAERVSPNGYSKTSAGTTYVHRNIATAKAVTQFQRTKLSAYPFPRAPTFQVDLGAARLLSGAALLSQLAK